jgi:phospholipid/cholesterol/gamma-HCH transport system ATP-binding protein
VIEFKNLVKSFGARQVLRGINFRVDTGKIAFILGTSGTGKSVLLKNLVGLLKPDSGEIWIENQEVSKYSEDEYLEIRKICGMVFQQPALFDSLSVFDNVAFGLRKHRIVKEDQVAQRVREALDSVHVRGVEHKFPQDISYGTQKRVSLARTVALRPRILLFDEPTTGLDPITTTAVNELIQELSRQYNTTSLVVSHDMKCALDIADHIVVLHDGVVAEQGNPKYLRTSQVRLVKDFLAEVIRQEEST